MILWPFFIAGRCPVQVVNLGGMGWVGVRREGIRECEGGVEVVRGRVWFRELVWYGLKGRGLMR